MFLCSIMGVWENISLLAKRHRGVCKRERRDGVWQQQWIIYDTTDWPHAAPLLHLLFFPNCSHRKLLLCCCFCSKPLTIHATDFKQTSKQTSIWNLWSTARLFHILLPPLPSFFCSQQDVQCSRIFYNIRMCLHAVLVTSPHWRLKSSWAEPISVQIFPLKLKLFVLHIYK